jgi:dynactin 1
LNQSAKNARLALFSATDENGSLVVPTEWKPPGWEALKNISLGRFACLGAAAVLSSAVSPIEDSENEPPPATPKHFADVVTKTKQGCSFMLDICKNLAGLQLNDTDKLNSLDELSCQYYSHSKDLYECISTTLDGESITIEDVDKFSSLMDSVLSSAKQIAALVRKTGWSENDNIQHHYLSAEYEDSWGGITTVVSQARILDGDAEDVNYLMRARAIENLLEEAVQNEPKLVIANSKIASLEKVSRLYG